MNYIISSIILLAVVLIIIYILSIDNNMEKFSNKIKEVFNTVKSNKLNFLSEKDNMNLLYFIKSSFKYDDNVIIPKKIFYTKTENGYEINDLDIICYKYHANTFTESPYKVNILFVPFEKDHYMSNQSLLGMHGNYKMDIVSFEKKTMYKNEEFKNDDKPIERKASEKNSSEKSQKKVRIDTNDVFIPAELIPSESIPSESINKNEETDILDMIPDIIHLTSEDDTTDTIALISHNLK